MSSSPSRTQAAASGQPSAAATGQDRRARRRRETVDEILDVAVEVMAVDGVGGLSLTEVARRMGMQPPSLYKYFPSKLAVYDALFARGVAEHRRVVESAVAGLDAGLEALRVGTDASVRWCVEHPVLAQLLYWRPVPGFEPSPEAFAPAVALMDRTREIVAAAVAAGELHPAAASETGLRLFTVLQSGVISQQLANEPGSGYDDGRFSSLTPRAFEMFVRYYAPAGGTP